MPHSGLKGRAVTAAREARVIECTDTHVAREASKQNWEEILESSPFLCLLVEPRCFCWPAPPRRHPEGSL